MFLADSWRWLWIQLLGLSWAGHSIWYITALYQLSTNTYRSLLFLFIFSNSKIILFSIVDVIMTKFTCASYIFDFFQQSRAVFLNNFQNLLSIYLSLKKKGHKPNTILKLHFPKKFSINFSLKVTLLYNISNIYSKLEKCKIMISNCGQYYDPSLNLQKFYGCLCHSWSFLCHLLMTAVQLQVSHKILHWLMWHNNQ